MNIEAIWGNWPHAPAFSGVFSVRDTAGLRFEACRGHRNRSDQLPCNRNTAFGIASGTKLFTALAACRLMDAGRLSLSDRLWDIVPHDLGRINRDVTVQQLLTHTSGVGDYIDEEGPDSLDQLLALYRRYPVYLWKRLEDYLPMITPLPQKFAPGARFGYSNAGFVLLGLVIEAASGQPYQQYVTDTIIQPLGLGHTGFYAMDALPRDTALGYMEDGRANIFHMPIIGGADGGLFTCADDLDTLWRALFEGRILSPATREALLAAQVDRGGGKSYGLGVYRYDHGGETAYYAVGGDFGVDCFTSHFPRRGLTATALGNTELNTYPLLEAMLAAL